MSKDLRTKDLIDQIKKEHKESVEIKLSSTPQTSAEIFEWQEKKSIKWWGWIVILIFSTLTTCFAFLVGWLLRNNMKINQSDTTLGAVGWICLTFNVLWLLSWMILGLIRNNQARKYFNDRSRRYQKTFTDQESILLMWKRICFLTTLLMIIPTTLTLTLI